MKFFFSDADKRRWIIGAWLAVVAGVLWVAVKIVMGPLYEPLGLWRWFESNAVYYRITTDLETEGQPFQLDVIVRCGGVGSVSYIGGGGAVYYQQLPYLYGKPTPAGHAVLMRVPNFCGLIVSGYPSAYAYREKLKQKVDILPLMLWMPDKNDIERMTAYTSLAGYESEGSQLRYRGTRYAEVTRPEWKSWMESSGKPFITRANDPFFKWRPVEGRDGRGLRCYAVRLNTIPEELRDEVARARPADGPLAWTDDALFYRLYPKVLRANGSNNSEINRHKQFSGGTSFSIDWLPYVTRNVLQAPPFSTKYEAEALIDLDSPLRGRAECSRVFLGLPTAINFTMQGRAGFVPVKWAIFIDDKLMLDFSQTGNIEAIEGSSEDMYP